ncbi:MAG: PQQ-dependent sugar dehydrogenase [Ginsengibacter sp.]
MKRRYSLQKLIGIFLIFLVGSCQDGQVNQSKKDVSQVIESDSNKLHNTYALDKIKLPPGFKIEVYAEIKGARQMCVSPEGTLFVGTKGKSVYAVPDANHDGKADNVYEIATRLNIPNGVAIKNGNLYIGTISTIYRIDNIEKDLSNPAKAIIVYDKYPTDTHHGMKFIAFGPDGKLYVPVGAPCNICEPEKPIYASMTRINDDGTGFEIFAKGIRNTVGFDWDPQSGNIWFTDNGRDMLGDDVPNDELNMASRPGMNFGYPYCHQGNILDPEFGKGKNCSDYDAPAQLLGAHVASLGLRFNKENKFPAEYDHTIFIAEHGSWNRSTPVGYQVVSVKLDKDGKAQKPEVFASGWLQNVRDVSGRPVDVQFLKDGSLLVSDDYAGAIYKISYSK